jgi:hypothetical protein
VVVARDRARFPSRPSDSRSFYPCYQIGVKSGPDSTVTDPTMVGARYRSEETDRFASCSWRMYIGGPDHGRHDSGRVGPMSSLICISFSPAPLCLQIKDRGYATLTSQSSPRSRWASCHREAAPVPCTVSFSGCSSKTGYRGARSLNASTADPFGTGKKRCTSLAKRSR